MHSSLLNVHVYAFFPTKCTCIFLAFVAETFGHDIDAGCMVDSSVVVTLR